MSQLSSVYDTVGLIWWAQLIDKILFWGSRVACWVKALDRIRKFLVETPIGALMGLETQPYYEAPGDFWVDK